MISIVSPIYNEAENLEELVQRVILAMESTSEEFEYILVENGSTDNSLDIIQSLHGKDPRIKYLSLSRNFGHQGGIFAGLSYACGNAVVSLDGDLQQAPELIPSMIKRWKQGYDVVYTTKKETHPQIGLRLFFRRWFYRVISFVADINLSYGQSDFRLLDRKVVDELKNIPEKRKFLRGLVDWVGFKQSGIEYEVDPRKYGKSKFSLWNYLGFAMDGILSFSSIPLRIFLYFGLGIALLCFIYVFYALGISFAHLMGYKSYTLPPGWLSVSVSILFLGAVQMIGIGILGEYIGRIFTQTKGRPEFIVKECGLEENTPKSRKKDLRIG